MSSTTWTLNEVWLPFCLLCLRQNRSGNNNNNQHVHFSPMVCNTIFAALLYIKKQGWIQFSSPGVLWSLGHQFYSLELSKTHLQGERGFCAPSALSMWYKLYRKKNTSATQWWTGYKNATWSIYFSITYWHFWKACRPRELVQGRQTRL